MNRRQAGLSDHNFQSHIKHLTDLWWSRDKLPEALDQPDMGDYIVGFCIMYGEAFDIGDKRFQIDCFGQGEDEEALAYLEYFVEQVRELLVHHPVLCRDYAIGDPVTHFMAVAMILFAESKNPDLCIGEDRMAIQMTRERLRSGTIPGVALAADPSYAQHDTGQAELDARMRCLRADARHQRTTSTGHIIALVKSS